DLRAPLDRLRARGRSLDVLHEAEMLAEALGDQRRMAQVANWMTNSFWMSSDYDRALASGQRWLALARAIGDVGSQAGAHNSLGTICYFIGDYRRAIEILRQNVVLLTGAHSQERFGLLIPPSVWSRVFFVRCL